MERAETGEAKPWVMWENHYLHSSPMYLIILSWFLLRETEARRVSKTKMMWKFCESSGEHMSEGARQKVAQAGGDGTEASWEQRKVAESACTRLEKRLIKNRIVVLKRGGCSMRNWETKRCRDQGLRVCLTYSLFNIRQSTRVKKRTPDMVAHIFFDENVRQKTVKLPCD